MRQALAIGVNLNAPDLDSKVRALNEKFGKAFGFLRVNRSVMVRIALEQLYASGKLDSPKVAERIGGVAC